MDLIGKPSCDGFPSSSSTSSKSRINFPFQRPEVPPGEPKQEQSECPFSTSSSTSSTIAAGYFKEKESECQLGKPTVAAPNVRYELAVAKSIMQQYSSLSGDNLFDHLSDIIKRIIDERPPNVIDFFEEFSRNVREQKFHLPERFPSNAIFDELRMFRVAKKNLAAMKLPLALTSTEEEAVGEEIMEESILPQQINYDPDDLKLDITGNAHLFKYFNERVQQLQFYWNQCGFSISNDDIFMLALAIHRLQTHHSILQCRFWGVINGLKKSYYIVEASLTQDELARRIEKMENEMRENYAPLAAEPSFHTSDMNLIEQNKLELIPGGVGWEHWPQEELDSMMPAAKPIPEVVTVDVFDVAPEPIGFGTNRYSYFVINTFSDDWIELPVVTPRQILVSRQIKKFFTGDLEADVISYPCFPGKEKHYLRAMIARITAGTYIAPEGYYRKMTKKEKRMYDGVEDDEEEGAEEEEEELIGEGEEGEIDNDVILLKNIDYDPLPLGSLAPLHHWVHVRPNILLQGRVVWMDLEKARRERDKELERLRKLELAAEDEEEEEEEAEEEEEGEGEEEEDMPSEREIGPNILTPVSHDTSDQFTVPWVARFTSRFVNKNERVLVIKSNTWPGAYTFTFEKVCESIYMGWGHKYVARNMPFAHLPPLLSEYPHTSEDFIEAEDPTFEEEENYRLGLLRKTLHSLDDGAEQLSDLDEIETESEMN